MEHDVIIIGGSYSGMAAALQLVRARRKVLVIDAGQRRNRFASQAHGFLTQDGVPPDVIAAQAGVQLAKYPTLTWVEGKADTAKQLEGGFEVTTEDGGRFTSRRLLLALGVKDHLPEIPGLAERWGQSLFHCPYCHGFELDQGPIGVIGIGAISMHQASMLPDWGPTTFLTNGSHEPNKEELELLERRGTSIEPGEIAEISGKADVRLKDGRVLSFAGLFVAPRIEPSSPIAQKLGCEIEDTPIGQIIKANDMKETSVPFVFACGDVARMAGSIALAVGDGAMAAAAVHQSLMFR